MYPFKVQKSETFNVFTVVRLQAGPRRTFSPTWRQALCPPAASMSSVLCASPSAWPQASAMCSPAMPAPPPLCPCSGTPHALPGRKVSTPLRGLTKLLRAQKRPQFRYPLLSDCSLVIKNNNKKMMMNKRENRRRDRGSICCLLQSPKRYFKAHDIENAATSFSRPRTARTATQLIAETGKLRSQRLRGQRAEIWTLSSMMPELRP